MRSTLVALALLMAADAAYAQAVRQELRQSADRSEQELADLFRQRPEVRPAAEALHELRADLRILHRWLCGVGAAAPLGSELEAAVSLRAMDVAALVQLADEQTSPPTRPQQEAMIRLRRLTYGLPAKPDLAAMDKVLAEAATETAASLGLAAPAPAAVRPKPMAQQGTRTATDAATLSELGARVRTAAISVDLRRQLLALVEACRLVADDPAARAEHADLSAALEVALQLTDALSANTAVSPGDRGALEGQLAEALVLFADARTRDAGRSRLRAMDEYRKLVEAIEGLELTGDAATQLQPALLYARSHPGQREVVLTAIRTYAETTAQFEQRPPAAASLPGTYARIAEAIVQRFETARRNVLTSAGQLGEGTFATSPQDLTAEVEQLRTLGELVQAIEQLPASLALLNESKPLPTGAIEERVKRAVAAVQEGEEAAEAQAFLLAMHRVRVATETLEAATADPLPAEIDEGYAAGRLASLLRWVPNHVAALAKGAAEGRSIEPAAIDQLQTAARLIDIARELAMVEATLQTAGELQPWGDWRLDTATLQAATAGHRIAYADAVTAVMAGQENPMAAFDSAEQRYGPLLDYLNTLSAYAEVCRAMSDEPKANIDRLALPSNVKIFERERKLSVLLRELAAEIEEPEKREERLKQINALLPK